MAVSPKLATPSAEQLPVQTYQLWIEKEGLRILTPRGFNSNTYQIKSDETSLGHRTLLTFLAMLRDSRLNQEETKLFGEHLYDVLLGSGVGEMLHAALLSEPHAFLRVELYFNKAPKALADLPWEYLYRPALDTGGGYFLALQERIALIRRPEVQLVKRPLGVPPGEELRVLLVACSPCDQDKLEFSTFVDEMRTLPNVKLTTLVTPHVDRTFAAARGETPEATFENFRRAIRESPHIVHFLGHGKVDPLGGSIAFVDSGFEAQWSSSQDLKEVFRNSSVRFAFLQACQTSAQGDANLAYRALSSVAGALADTGIPAIVAMQAKIEIGKASSFASVFYHSIVEQRLPLFRAMQLARNEAKDAACIPVLYLRYDGSSGNQADLLFEESAADSSQSSPAKGGSVNVGGGKCPWCYDTLDQEQAEQDCCSFCKSDLRCPNVNCRSPFKGMVRPGADGLPRDSVFCQQRNCPGTLRRYKEPTHEALRSEKAVPPLADIRSLGGDLQRDVFSTPEAGGANRGH